MNFGTLGALEVVVVQNSGCGFFWRYPIKKVTNPAKKVFLVFQQEMNHIEKPLIFRKYVRFFFAGVWGVTGKFSGGTVLI